MQTNQRRFALALLLGASAVASPTLGDVIYVDPDALLGSNNGTSWLDAYRNLQVAIAAAESGDTIRISAGTYKPGTSDRGNSFVLEDGVSLEGGYAGWGMPDPDVYDPTLYATVLSGDRFDDDGGGNFSENYYRVIRASGEVTLKGLTVQGGNADDDDQFTGGGLYCPSASVTVTDCVFQDNRASYWGGGIFGGVVHMNHCVIRRNYNSINVAGAGGVYAQSGSTFTACEFSQNGVALASSAAALSVSNASIHACVFLNNTASEDGGAIFGSNLLIEDSMFVSNSAGYFAGALYLNGNNTVRNCGFLSNQTGVSGGAIYLSSGTVEVRNCWFVANSASGGGAIRLGSGNASIVRSHFTSNYAFSNGGGAMEVAPNAFLNAVNCSFVGHLSYGWWGGAIDNGGTTDATNCYFSGNRTDDRGGAIFNTGVLALTNCTIVGNRSADGGFFYMSGAVHGDVGSFTQIDNCIVRENTNAGVISETSQLAMAGSSSVSHSLVHMWSGALGGVENSGADPQLIDADGDDDLFGTIDDQPHLAINSPARDAGLTDALPPDTFDLNGDGNVLEPVSLDLLGANRVQGASVDIGCVELDSCIADINGSGNVDIADLFIMIAQWGQCATACTGDINGDGMVNVTDLLTIIVAWGACPRP